MAVNPEIKKLTEKIRHTGPADQVRESIAGGMDLTSEEASATRKLADQTENRQTKVESDFKTLQREYTESGNGAQTTAEISLARDGEPVLADRLNRDFGNITAQFQQNEQKVFSYLYENGVNANDMSGMTAIEQIQNAIDFAELEGFNIVSIPSKMRSSGDWSITKAIELPSNMTLILNNAHLKLAAGTMDNIIVNKGARTSPLSPNENIHIIGIGGAVVDGLADINKNFPGASWGGEHHNDYRRIAINIFWTKGFSITGLKVRESQGYGISIENGSKDGLIRDIEFEMKNSVINQDGIDIRRGCSNIVIENIEGVTGDDMIALNCLNNQRPASEKGGSFQVGGGLMTYGENNNIENITIRNVKGHVAGRHNLIRLLVKDGNKIRNVNIDNVEDTSTSDMTLGSAVILLGANGYGTVQEDVLGDLSDITINNVRATGNIPVIVFGSHAKNIKLDKIEYKGFNSVGLIHVLNTNVRLSDIEIGKISVECLKKPTSESNNPYVFYYYNATIENLTIGKIDAKNVRYVLASELNSGGIVKNMIIDEINVNATAIYILRTLNPFDVSLPSFVRRITIKNIEDIFLDRNSASYVVGQYFKTSKNMYIENFEYPLYTHRGFLKEVIGEGSSLIITDQPSIFGTGFSLENGSVKYSVEKNRKLVRIKGTFKHPSGVTVSNSASTKIGAILPEYVPNEVRRVIVGSANSNFSNFVLLITTAGELAIRSLTGSAVSGINNVILDIEYEI